LFYFYPTQFVRRPTLGDVAMNCPRLRLLVLSLLCFSSIGLAEDLVEEPARGRLADGRAFRTDAEGNQLVDYIAELELSVEQLNRKVYGLEFELGEKQAQVERLTAAGARAQPLAERDLLKGNELRPAKVVSGASGFTSPAPTERAELVVATAQEPDRDCAPEVAAMQQQLEKVRFDLDVAQRVGAKNKEEVLVLNRQIDERQRGFEATVLKVKQESRQSCPDFSADVRRLSDELRKAQTAQQDQQKLLFSAQANEAAQLKLVSELRSKLVESEQRVQMNARLVTDLQDRVRERESAMLARTAEVSERSKEIEALRQDLLASKLEKTKIVTVGSTTAASSVALPVQPKIPAIEVAAAALDKVEQTANPVVPAANTPSAQPKPKFVAAPLQQAPERASFSAAKMRAVESLRGSMNSEMLRLRDMVGQRDALFQNYNKTGQRVTFKPSALVSSRNYSMAWISDRIKASATVHELSSLSKDIREIRARVQSDIELIKRMQRNAR
jgi:hypothetical protein